MKDLIIKNNICDYNYQNHLCDDIEFNEEEKFKIFLNLSLFMFLSVLLLFLFSGCARKEIVVKYKYIEKPCPKLQTIDLNELNLNPDKPLKFNFKIKEKGE